MSSYQLRFVVLTEDKNAPALRRSLDSLNDAEARQLADAIAGQGPALNLSRTAFEWLLERRLVRVMGVV